jgi:hypothetical protein
MSEQPTLTSKNLPPVQQPRAVQTSPPAGLPPKPPTSVEVAIPWEQIEAKPLRSPNFINLKPKNPNLSLFWGNRAVGEKESGLRYDQLIAMGFIPAVPTDVITSEGMNCPPSICRDGRIMYGDLILLKIPRTEYIGALKWNEQNARLRVKKLGVAIEGAGASRDIGGEKVLKDDSGRTNPTPIIPSMGGKVQAYVPALTEVDSKTSDNSGPTEKVNERDFLRKTGVLP